MNCQAYREYSMGDMPAIEFDTHCESCRECREALALDSLIEDQARQIQVPTTAPGLWDRIALEAGQDQKVVRPRFAMPRSVWQVAASLVFVIGLGLGSLWLMQPEEASRRPRNLLASDALAHVEAVEDEYIAAIGELERLAEPIIAAGNTELHLRYRARLETIDAQIRRCQAVLAEDNANAHVRRYLLAAYQDKTETLTQLLAQAAASGRDA